MNTIGSYKNLTIKQRIARALNDEDFIKHCQREKNKSDFDESFEMVKKIAEIDISGIDCDKSLIEVGHIFSSKQIKDDIISFYDLIDSLAPQGINLCQRLQDNVKYFINDAQGKNKRSYCKSGYKKDGTPDREIRVFFEGSIGDTENAIHEFAHSFSECFRQIINPKDRKTEEIPTVITDQLSSVFLKKKHPSNCVNYVENDRFRQILNVKKARECLLDALIVKVATGEVAMDEVTSNYGYLFKDFPEILNNRLDNIETFKFDVMFEKKYLIPQAIALEMRERFEQNPKLVAEQLKEIIANNHKWTEEETISYLGFNSKEQLIDGYVANFSKRMEQLDAEKLNAKQQFSMKK